MQGDGGSNPNMGQLGRAPGSLKMGKAPCMYFIESMAYDIWVHLS